MILPHPLSLRPTPTQSPPPHPFTTFTPPPQHTLHLTKGGPTTPVSVRCQCYPQVEIDMVRTHTGVYAPKQTKVVVLWDLDNKPPRGPPYEAAMALKSVAEKFGQVVEVSAYANRHAFSHLPSWVAEERRERRRRDVLERKGVVSPPAEAYVCSVCGRKCKTHFDLKKHFKELHEKERQKKLNRMRQLKGKKRQKFKERYLERNHKYEEAARTLITPKVGYGLARELRRAGVFVKTVEDKPQAADRALKKQIVHSMSRGIDWLFLVSDDGDFKDMLRKAREASLGTVVVGDWDQALGRIADLWVPWSGVEKGEIGEKDLVPKRRRKVGMDEEEGVWGEDGDGVEEGMFSVSEFGGGEGSDLDRFVDELVSSDGRRDSGVGRLWSMFSDDELDDDDDGEDDDYLLDSEDEFEEED